MLARSRTWECPPPRDPPNCPPSGPRGRNAKGGKCDPLFQNRLPENNVTRMSTRYGARFVDNVASVHKPGFPGFRVSGPARISRVF
jgi:hypothetical protein